MGLFSSIMEKIFHHGAPAAPAPAAAAPQAAPADAAPVAPVAAPAAPPEPVDVEAVLSGMADQKGGGGNWRTSIVDLLKLLDMDSSLSARKELANELDVHAGDDGTAEENIALHAAVVEKRADSCGTVPDNLRHRAHQRREA